jgi:hypothetical protein
MAWKGDSAPHLRITRNTAPPVTGSARLGSSDRLPRCRQAPPSGDPAVTATAPNHAAMEAYTVSQRQPKVTPGSQQCAAKLSLPCPNFLFHFQMQFVKGRDGPFCRHPGTHQPPNHFCQINSMDSRAIQNSIRTNCAFTSASPLRPHARLPLGDPESVPQPNPGQPEYTYGSPRVPWSELVNEM